MEDLTGKVDGTTALAPAEWNQSPAEIQEAITNILSGALDAGDLNQLGQALAGYSGAAHYYVDSGAADAYEVDPVGTRLGAEDLTAKTDGFLLRFRPDNDNTGASTIEVAVSNGGADIAGGPRNIVRADGSGLQAGDLNTNQDAQLRFDFANDQFILLDHAIPEQSLTVSHRGHIAGLETSNGTDTQHDIDIAAGSCRDEDDTVTMVLGSTLTKRLDASWEAGSGNGGAFSSSPIATETWFHLYLIRRDSDGLIDAGWSTSKSNPPTDLPAGWSSYRRIASHLTDNVDTGNIWQFEQRGDFFHWKDDKLDGTDTTADDVDESISTTSVERAVSIPPFPSIANMAVFSGAGNRFVYVSNTSQNDEAAQTTGPIRSNIGQGAAASDAAQPVANILGSETSTVRIVADAAGTTRVLAFSYFDVRGRNAP